eukprot:TRINITY_DN2744_c0_g3_i2.p1 TRINITY_DN2744_c0_g3~~TRINITY_DN2744_c0_g3_i2.p1  ORF type:complete len:203 (-),score=-16.66 TRINITY_DN2744_c0_g3_i2:126-734(-)
MELSWKIYPSLKNTQTLKTSLHNIYKNLHNIYKNLSKKNRIIITTKQRKKHKVEVQILNIISIIIIQNFYKTIKQTNTEQNNIQQRDKQIEVARLQDNNCFCVQKSKLLQKLIVQGVSLIKKVTCVFRFYLYKIYAKFWVYPLTSQFLVTYIKPPQYKLIVVEKAQINKLRSKSKSILQIMKNTARYKFYIKKTCIQTYPTF